MNNLELNRYPLWTLRIQAGRKDGRKIVPKLLLILLLLLPDLTKDSFVEKKRKVNVARPVTNANY